MESSPALPHKDPVTLSEPDQALSTLDSTCFAGIPIKCLMIPRSVADRGAIGQRSYAGRIHHA
jgi:hypothetical protein